MDASDPSNVLSTEPRFHSTDYSDTSYTNDDGLAVTCNGRKYSQSTSNHIARNPHEVDRCTAYISQPSLSPEASAPGCPALDDTEIQASWRDHWIQVIINYRVTFNIRTLTKFVFIEHFSTAFIYPMFQCVRFATVPLIVIGGDIIEVVASHDDYSVWFNLSQGTHA